ncbi:hypothetical protein [Gluconobacter oxydans]|uniref:hypothetical protein n=1 Tax=Gluconobacter oxydans TaxID=442 RepID=UPI0039ECEFA4
MASAGKPQPTRPRCYDIALRLVVALPFGYALSALGGVCLAFWLPLSRADNAMAGILLGLILWPVIFMASFAVARIGRLRALLIPATCLRRARALLGGWRPGKGRAAPQWPWCTRRWASSRAGCCSPSPCPAP